MNLLYALSLAGESAGNLPRLLVSLVKGWLCDRRHLYTVQLSTLSAWPPSPPPMPPPMPPPRTLASLTF